MWAESEITRLQIGVYLLFLDDVTSRLTVDFRHDM